MIAGTNGAKAASVAVAKGQQLDAKVLNAKVVIAASATKLEQLEPKAQDACEAGGAADPEAAAGGAILPQGGTERPVPLR